MGKGDRIQFFIPFAAKPKQSCEFGRHGGYPKRGVTENAHLLATYALQFRPKTPIPKGVPVRLELAFRYAWREKDAKLTSLVRRWKYTRPDCDNLAKQVTDVLQHLQFFEDDQQIAALIVRKEWATEPGVFVSVSQLEDIEEALNDA